MAGRRLVQVAAGVVGGQVLTVDMTDRLAAVGIDAIRGVEAAGPLGELRQLLSSVTQRLDVLVDGGQVTIQEFDHVTTGGLPLTAQIEDGGNLGEGQPGGLGVPDELEPIDCVLGIVPVVVAVSTRLRKEPDLLVVAERLGGGPGPLGQLSDSHDSQSTLLDLPADWKVYRGRR